MTMLRTLEQEAKIETLRVALDEIRGHMGACKMQRAPSDDAIIFDHIESAHQLASDALKGL